MHELVLSIFTVIIRHSWYVVYMHKGKCEKEGGLGAKKTKGVEHRVLKEVLGKIKESIFQWAIRQA